jgi:hypothetical protein
VPEELVFVFDFVLLDDFLGAISCTYKNQPQLTYGQIAVVDHELNKKETICKFKTKNSG